MPDPLYGDVCVQNPCGALCNQCNFRPCWCLHIVRCQRIIRPAASCYFVTPLAFFLLPVAQVGIYLPYGRLFALQTCLEALAAQAAVNTDVKPPDVVGLAIFGHWSLGQSSGLVMELRMLLVSLAMCKFAH